MDCAFKKKINLTYPEVKGRFFSFNLLASSFQSTFPCVKVADLNAYFNFLSQKRGGNVDGFNSTFFGRAS